MKRTYEVSAFYFWLGAAAVAVAVAKGTLVLIEIACRVAFGYPG